MIKKYNHKIKETKNFLEVWIYSKPIKYGFRSKSKFLKRRKFEDLRGPEKINSLINRQKYYLTKQNEIRRIVDCNYDHQTSFLTLTQNKNSPIQDSVEIGNKEFQNFIKRLKRWLSKNKNNRPLKYLATWELTKKGKLHYHIILFSFPFISSQELERLWGHGFIKINKISGINKADVGLYISKYFSKDLEMKASKKKAYFKSQNLKMPDQHKLYLPDETDIEIFGTPTYHSEYIYEERKNDKLIQQKTDYYIIKKN